MKYMSFTRIILAKLMLFSLLSLSFLPFLPNLSVAGPLDLRITRVDPHNGFVWVRHYATAEVTLASDMAFCHNINYSTEIPAGTVFGAGEEKKFSVPGVISPEIDIWLYQGTSGFGNAANIVTGIKFGGAATDEKGRSAIARAAGKWDTPGGVAIPAPISGKILEIKASANPVVYPSVSTDWKVGLAPIELGAIRVGLYPVATGLNSPLGLESPAGDPRSFIYTQAGEVLILDANDQLLPTPFLDVSALLAVPNAGANERGLLGFCFHPDFATNGRFFTFTSEPSSGLEDYPTPAGGIADHMSVITEWSVNPADPNVADVSTRNVLLSIGQPQSNHNGGQLAFGPDGYLYIGLGDGGSANDSGSGHENSGNAQATTNPLGSILRIDVDATNLNGVNGKFGIPGSPNGNPFSSGVREIYAWGFRNPWRFGFTPSGDLLVADVGQNTIEEINLVERGRNYGWRFKEGTFFFDEDTGEASQTGGAPGSVRDPIAEYDHDDGVSIIGGHVAVTNACFPGLGGKYFFGDFLAGSSGRLFAMDPAGGLIEEVGVGVGVQPDIRITGFGQDASGQSYVIGSDGSDGRVYRLGAPMLITDMTVDATGMATIDFQGAGSETVAVAESSLDLVTTPFSAISATVAVGTNTLQATLPAAQDHEEIIITAP